MLKPPARATHIYMFVNTPAKKYKNVLELVQELVHEVLEPVQELKFYNRSFVLHEQVQELKFWNRPFVSELRNGQLYFFLKLQFTGTSAPIIPKFQGKFS